MRNLIKILAVLLFLYICPTGLMNAGVASAQVVTCTPPTQFVGGATIPAGTVFTYKAYKGATSTAASTVVTPFAQGTTCSFPDLGAAPGTFYTVTATVAGIESARPTPQAYAPVPNPPSFTVTAVVAGLNMNPVYRVNVDGTRGATLLGFVPVGTPCSGTSVYSYRGKRYFRVPQDAVKWEQTTPTANVAAACS